jgi:DNA-binding winged helix-turn-helix (wHTH) protein/Tol biopolymer transport system component
MLTFASFRFDPDRRHLEKDGEPLVLPAKALDTLALLVRERGRVVEKDEILSTVWPDAFVSEDSLTQVISLLRRALGDDSAHPLFIATVPRRGYRFTAAVTVVTPAPAPVDTAAPTPVTTGTLAAPAVLAATSPGRRAWTAALWAVPALIAVVLVARTVSVAQRGEPTGAPIHFLQTAPPGTQLSSGGVLSPDGRYLVFVSHNQTSGRDQLWLRPLDSAAPRLVAGTEGAFRPFWSPDSQTLGFFADGKLKRVGVDGGAPQTLASVGYRPSGGSWSSRGVILYADRISQLFSVPDNGGTPAPATALDRGRGEFGHHDPQFLPDGDHFLFYAESTMPGNNATFVASLSSGERTRLLDQTVSYTIFAPPGYLLYVKDDVLMAQRFDPQALRLTGPATRLSTINASQEEGAARIGQLSASTNGLLAFGGSRAVSHLTWFSRDGRELGMISGSKDIHNPMVSPDERMLVGNGGAGAGGGIWILDLERGAPTRIAEGGNLAAWSHDGARVTYTSRRDAGAPDIAIRAIGDSQEEILLRTNEMKISGNWSPDGRAFTFVSSNAETRLDLWLLERINGTTTPRTFLRSPANEMQPQVSPDGRWLAYASDETGTWEVYVQSFPTPGQKRTLSVGGGAQPEWRRDGRELYYLSLDGTLMAIDVTTGTTFEAARPRPLFPLPVDSDVIGMRNQYVVTGNGERFIVDASVERDPIHIVVNWNALVNP